VKLGISIVHRMGTNVEEKITKYFPLKTQVPFANLTKGNVVSVLALTFFPFQSKLETQN